MLEFIYKTDNGTIWSVSKATDHFGEELFRCFPMGGGFMHHRTTMPPGRIISMKEYKEKILNLVEGIASIDGEGNYPCHFSPDERWNGWHIPYMSKDVAKAFFADAERTVVFCTEGINANEYMQVWSDDISDPERYVPNQLGLYKIYDYTFECSPVL